MSDPNDMDKPVTKREMLSAFENFLGALTTRFEALEHRLTAEIRAQVRAIGVQHRDDLTAVDEQYKDLPGRVQTLETAVFRPGPPLKRQRRR